MYNILFYIFASITLLAAMYIAFSGSSKAAFKGLAYMLAGVSGFLALLNNNFLSAILILGLFAIISLYSLSYNYSDKFIFQSVHKSSLNILQVTAASLLAAILTAVLGAAKWQFFEVNPGFENKVLVFTKYLPVILFTGLTISVLVSAAIVLFSKLVNR